LKWYKEGAARYVKKPDIITDTSVVCYRNVTSTADEDLEGFKAPCSGNVGWQ
jgi:hypothetical protein